MEGVGGLRSIDGWFLTWQGTDGQTQQRQVLFHEHCWHIPRRVIATLFQPNRATGTFCFLDNRINWPGGGGGGLVGVPVFGGRAGGTSELAGWLSSWKRFLLSTPNCSAPFDWNEKVQPNQIYRLHKQEGAWIYLRTAQRLRHHSQALLHISKTPINKGTGTVV